MKKDVLISIIDEMFHDLRIPIAIMDDQLNLIYPKITVINIHDLLNGILFISPDKIQILVVEHKSIYGCFPFKMDNQTHYLVACALLSDIENINQEIPQKWIDILPEDIINKHIKRYHLEGFTHIMTLLYSIIYHEIPSDKALNIEYINTSDAPVSDNDSLTMRLTYQNTPDYYRWEQSFFESFIKGNFSEIRTLIKEAKSFDVVSLDDNLIQEQIYKFISFITLLTRRTIQEGTSAELAFSLSDSYIKKLNYVHNSQTVTHMIEQAIYDFYHLMNDSKKQIYSLNIYKCLHYIDTHLYDRLSLYDLTVYTNLSSSYLSSIFKKEVGENITHYIQRKKIEEATRLLLFTNKSFIDISNLLHFNSQSNFIQIFKKYKEMTPKQYQLYHLK